MQCFLHFPFCGEPCRGLVSHSHFATVPRSSRQNIIEPGTRLALLLPSLWQRTSPFKENCRPRQTWPLCCLQCNEELQRTRHKNQDPRTNALVFCRSACIQGICKLILWLTQQVVQGRSEQGRAKLLFHFKRVFYLITALCPPCLEGKYNCSSQILLSNFKLRASKRIWGLKNRRVALHCLLPETLK